MARARTHIRAPLVRPVIVPLDLVTVIFFCQLLGDSNAGELLHSSLQKVLKAGYEPWNTNSHDV